MRRGFTLIELLIVVAIIAILAAIAIPNFLQAQTRAKVSRCQADMRSIATALESYYVDNNKYPPCGYEGVPEDSGWHYLNFMLTTPVAYLTDIGLDDPFYSGHGVTSEMLEAYPWYPFLRYVNYDLIYNDLHSDAPLTDWATRYSQVYGMWGLFSRGPEGITTFGGDTLTHVDGSGLWLSAVPYDPTNGTVSRGDIVRCQLNEPNYGYIDW